MAKRSPLFKMILFALMAVWFVLLTASFFITSPIAIVGLLPDILLICVVILAAYGAGSFLLEWLRIDETKPTEDFILATSIGLGILAWFSALVAQLGLLTWWTVAIGLIIFILVGSSRILGLITQPSYLFGPEDLSEEKPTPLSWMQYIVIALWVVALFHFCLLPPVAPASLAGNLGWAGQWLANGTISNTSTAASETLNMTTGLYAMALAFRGPHLAMMLSALVGGLTLGMLYSGAKRYCGSVASRSTLLIASSVPVFSYMLLSPGDGMLMALYQFCAFFCMLRWFDEKGRRWAVLGGAMLGLSLSVSAISIFFGAPLLVGAFVWALTRQRARRFLLHIVFAGGMTALILLPWIVLYTWLFGSPLGVFAPLTALDPVPLSQWFGEILFIPMQISYPIGFLPPWRLVGPIFLVFVPFYFFTVRKNPMTGLATAIGLATLAFGKPFGVVLEYRLVAIMLLAVPAAMAAHRMFEEGWMRNVTLAMLYTLIAGHIFFATATVEEVFYSPHRYLLGLETDDEYLDRTVPYYRAAREINRLLPLQAHVLSLGQDETLYINRRISVADQAMQDSLIRLLVEQDDLQRGLARMLSRGYTHLLVNRRGIANNERLLAAADSIEDRLAAKRIIHSGDIAVYALY